jgi:hypothetical protein
VALGLLHMVSASDCGTWLAWHHTLKLTGLAGSVMTGMLDPTRVTVRGKSTDTAAQNAVGAAVGVRVGTLCRTEYQGSEGGVRRGSGDALR